MLFRALRWAEASGSTTRVCDQQGMSAPSVDESRDFPGKEENGREVLLRVDWCFISSIIPPTFLSR